MTPRVFIDRPRLAGVISIVLTLGGLLAMRSLPITQYPEITPPQVNVQIMYPGASSEVLADTVAAPLEEEMNGVEGMLYMASESDDQGNYQLTVTFEVGTDLDIARVRVQNRIQQATSKLPAEVKEQGVAVRTRSSSTLGIITFASPKGTRDRLFMSNYANSYMKDAFKRIPGVGDAMVWGPQYSMRVWMDANRLSALGLTGSDVIAAIRTQNVQASIGSVGAAPGDSESQMVYSLRAEGRLNDPVDFENIVVRTDENGGVVRLKDVGRVEMGGNSYAIGGKLNGEPSVGMMLSQTPGSNALEAMDAVRAEMARLSEWFPEDLECDIFYDATEYIRVSIKGIVVTLLITVALVVLVCYIFLQDWRATLVPSLTIPVSLIATFGVMMALGYSINTLTLFALVLAIGIVVDDAIVVVERVLHLMEEEKLDHREATIKAMSEVTGAIVATTMVLLAIFIPVAFVGGITGRIYQQFAVTICIAVLFSSTNALTLSPALCSTILHVARLKQHGPLAWFNSVLFRSRRGYVSASMWLACRKTMTVLVFAMVAALCAGFLGSSQSAFIPDEDQGVVFGDVRLPEGANLARNQAFMDHISEVVQGVEGVRAVMAVPGFSILGGRSENVGLLVLALDDWDDRKQATLKNTAIQQTVAAALASEPGAQVNFFSPPAIPGISANGGLDFRLQAIGDTDPKKLEATLNGLLGRVNQDPHVMAAFSSYTANTPHLHVEVDRTKAESLGVPVSTVFATLQSYLGSRYVNDINVGNRVNQVYVQADWPYRKDLEDLKGLYVRSTTGNMVPMESLVTVETTLSPRLVPRYNLYPSASVNVMLRPGASSGDAMAAVERIAAESLPEGYAYEWSGMSYQEKQTAGQLPLLVAMAFIFGYLFLVAQYESWATPISVVLSTAVAILGALAGLRIAHLPLSIYAQLGMILLVGLASKNAILIVKFCATQREAGESILESAAHGARERFRAVLMTAFTFILGTLPLVIATGAGSASRRAIGSSVCSGMLAATLFGIILVPALYVLFQSLREWGKRRLAMALGIHEENAS